MNFGSVAFLFCTSLFLLLGIFLISTRRAWNFGMQWLGALFICLALNYIDGLLFLGGYYISYPNFAFIEDPFVLLYGPFLFFFSLGIRQIPWKNKYLVHVIPFLAAAIGIFLFYHTLPVEEKLEVLNKISLLNLPPEFLWTTGIIFLHFFSYGLIARYQIRAYRKTLKGYYSVVEIDWAAQIVDLILMILAISIMATMIEALGEVSLYMNVLVGMAIITTVLTARILLRALKEPIFALPADPGTGMQLEQELEERIKGQITQALDKKIYQNPTLSLEDMAKAVGFSPRQVSHVINKNMADNFYDLINQARISEARTLLKSNPEMNITQVMYAAGYNSKSSFNTQFKKITGKTPSAFRKEAG